MSAIVDCAAAFEIVTKVGKGPFVSTYTKGGKWAFTADANN